MTAVYYTAAGIVLYLAADWILRWLERRAGRVFEYRTLVFFLLLSGMALGSFAVIRSLVAPD
jgi:predicted PurR-regulated permease PerM